MLVWTIEMPVKNWPGSSLDVLVAIWNPTQTVADKEMKALA